MKTHLLLALALLIAAEALSQKKKTLFNSDTVLNIQLMGNVNSVVRDRSENSEYKEFTLIVNDGEANSNDTVPVRLKTRGNFRRSSGECRLPPIMVNFTKKKIPEGSLFGGQDKLKLVVPCIDDQLLLKEYLVYKLYNEITKYSFRARLVRVQWVNTKGNPDGKPFYAFFLEDENDVAKRNETKLITQGNPLMQNMDLESFLKMTVFEFMIGNTDWSISYRHNVRIFAGANNSAPIPVPYDFDFSGLVSPPYATPPEELNLSSVRERRYRGYCIADLNTYKPTFDYFKTKRQAFEDIVNNCEGMTKRTKEDMLDFMKEFYKIIESEKEVRYYFAYPCDASGTGNVNIKGLNNN